MAIDKSPIWVGSTSGQNGTIIDGLKLMRRYETFEGNRETEYIKVVYTEWFEGESGSIYNSKYKSYFVKDIPEVSNILDDNGNIVKVGHDAYPNYTNWYNQLGANVIVPAINSTLIAIPANAKDNYLTHPDNIDV